MNMKERKAVRKREREKETQRVRKAVRKKGSETRKMHMQIQWKKQ